MSVFIKKKVCSGQKGHKKNKVQTWHLSKHVSQTTKSLSVQFHSAGQEGIFQEEVHPHPLRHRCWDENTQILQEHMEQSWCQ